MKSDHEKRRRLAYVARRYYLDDQKQSDIAAELGVSRPMVSRLLTEARQLGVVEITVHDPEVEAASLLEQLQSCRLGVGWGHLIGQLVTWLEKNPRHGSSVTDICPLVGNASIPARNYQSNENVRLMAQQLGASPHFLYLPALPESLEEKQILCSTEIYRQIHEEWEQIDTALVNIGDYPSSPDFASLVRYGGLLQEHHACGRMLVYYFNEDGTVIQSDQDFAIQVPLEILKQCPNIIGVCSANTSAKAVKGALKSGIRDPHRGPVLPHPLHPGTIVIYVTSQVYFISLRGFAFVQYA